MARRNDSILDILATLPWWASVIVAGTAYYTLGYYLPTSETQSILFQSLAKAGPTMAPWAALFFLIPAPISGSSAESVGNLGCRQVANCMIQGYF